MQAARPWVSVPEPASFLLMATGLLMLAAVSRKRLTEVKGGDAWRVRARTPQACLSGARVLALRFFLPYSHLTMTRPNPSPWAVVGLYLFAAMLVLLPLSDLFSTAFPPRLTDLNWRYGFMGLGAGYLQTPLLGLVIAAGVAYWQSHAGMLRTLGVLGVVLAVLVLMVVVLWPMDVMRIRALREPQAQAGVAIGGALQELKYVMGFLVLSVFGVGCVKTAPELARASRREAQGIVSRG